MKKTAGSLFEICCYNEVIKPLNHAIIAIVSYNYADRLLKFFTRPAPAEYSPQMTRDKFPVKSHGLSTNIDEFPPFSYRK